MGKKRSPVWSGKIGYASEKTWLKPFSWRTPSAVFVNSMGDLFHEDVPDEMIDKAFAIMALNPQHIFIILTKRAKRMREYCSTIQSDCRWLNMENIALSLGKEPRGNDNHGFDWISHHQFLPNVRLGVSVEDQATANERIPHLLATPAAVRFVSCEPLLGPVDLTMIEPAIYAAKANALSGIWSWEDGPTRKESGKLDWVIAGGESGKDARPMHPDWARSLRDQCAYANVPLFFKQWGEWAPGKHVISERFGEMFVSDDHLNIDGSKTERIIWQFDQWQDWKHANSAEPLTAMARVGKARAGHLLDGVAHHAWPDCVREMA